MLTGPDRRIAWIGKLAMFAGILGLGIAAMGMLGGSALKVGDRAPEFSLSDQNGKIVKLADYHGKQPVVLAFYPRASTPGCTREVRGLQTDIGKFNSAGAQVLGISVDSAERNRKFAEETGANFPLLCDTDKKVAKAYGVLHFTRLFANRVTFVIDKDGVIQHIEKDNAAIDHSGALGACALRGK
jgi:peroxiredoxin Q/BCP